jgi:hypothetical protein
MEIQGRPQKPRIYTDLSWLKPSQTHKDDKLTPKPKEDDKSNHEIYEAINPTTEEKTPLATEEALPNTYPVPTPRIFSELCKDCRHLVIEDATALCFYGKYFRHEDMKSCPLMQRPANEACEHKELQYSLFELLE